LTNKNASIILFCDKKTQKKLNTIKAIEKATEK